LAVSSVKTYACSAQISSSKKVSAMAIAQDTTEIGLRKRLSALSRAKPPSVNTSSSMWPANIFGEETEGEREWLEDERLQCLDRQQQRLHVPRGGQHGRVLEIAEDTVLLDAW